MVRVSRQTFELPPHLPTYQAKNLVGVSRFSVHSAVQCSAVQQRQFSFVFCRCGFVRAFHGDGETRIKIVKHLVTNR